MNALRDLIVSLSPSATLKQLPNFNFSSIYTTNYDTLVEKSFEYARVDLPVIKSNKDYKFDHRQYNTMLYKLHGSIDEDRADGLSYGMIVTDEDYSTYGQYRQIGFGSFSQSLSISNFVFVGYSLADPNIKEFVDKAIALSKTQETSGDLYLLIFEEDELEAMRWEQRGLKVAFGSLDKLLSSLATVKETGGGVGIFSPITSAPRHAVAAAVSAMRPNEEAQRKPNLQRVLTGGDVTYSDIRQGFAFPRSVSSQVVQQIVGSSISQIHVLLGPSGCGKTSAARLALMALEDRTIACYEHKSNIGIDLETWKEVDHEHLENGTRACLFLDEPNTSQLAVNQLAEYLNNGQTHALSLIITYHPSIWTYRTKSAALVKRASSHAMSHLTPADILSIANHVRQSPQIAKSLSPDIQSKNHHEIVKMIQRKANADLFVCLKYLFEAKSLDEIVLREYENLGNGLRPDVIRAIKALYSATSFLETCGRHVHRQMVLRVSDVSIDVLHEALEALEGVVFEAEREERVEPIYTWKTRHPRIAAIIAESKFSRAMRRTLIENTIRTINPSSRVERQFAAQLCNSELGIESFEREQQTEMYRMLSDALPGERVPRHRLIRNLIKQKKFGEAELAISEARDMKINDSVIYRYDVELDVKRAENLAFLEHQDRINLLESAIDKARTSISRRPDDMYNYRSFCDVGLALAVESGLLGEFEESVTTLLEAYDRLGDRLMLEWIGKYQSELTRLRRETGT